MTMTKRPGRLLWRGTPSRFPQARTHANRSGARHGTGEYRLSVTTQWQRFSRRDNLVLGLSVSRNGYVEELRAQGWQSRTITVGVLFGHVEFHVTINDKAS